MPDAAAAGADEVVGALDLHLCGADRGLELFGGAACAFLLVADLVELVVERAAALGDLGDQGDGVDAARGNLGLDRGQRGFEGRNGTRKFRVAAVGQQCAGLGEVLGGGGDQRLEVGAGVVQVRVGVRDRIEQHRGLVHGVLAGADCHGGLGGGALGDLRLGGQHRGVGEVEPVGGLGDVGVDLVEGAVGVACGQRVELGLGRADALAQRIDAGLQ